MKCEFLIIAYPIKKLRCIENSKAITTLEGYTFADREKIKLPVYHMSQLFQLGFANHSSSEDVQTDPALKKFHHLKH